LTWPVTFHLGDRIFGGPGDSTGTIGGFWEFAHRGGFHLFGSHQNTYTGAPFGWRQGNGINVTSALLYYPLYLGATIGQETAAYNLVVLSGLVFSALAMYVLVRRLGMSIPVAAWGALVYTVFPWHLEKAQGHASLAHLEGFPLLVLASLSWYRRPDLRRALLLAGAIAVLWTTAGYFGVIGFVALTTLLLVAAVMQRARLGARRVVRLFSLGFAPSLLVVLVVDAMGRLGAGFNGVATARSVGDLAVYGARPWEFVIPSYRNIVFGGSVSPWLAKHLHGSNFSETSLFVGWLTLLLAIFWIAYALTRRTKLGDQQAFATVALAAIVLVGLVCSLPSPLPHTGIPMPARFIWQLAPEFRVSSRFIAIVMTGLVPLASFSLEAIRSSLTRATNLRRAAPVLAVTVCVVAWLLSYLELAFAPPAITTRLTPPPPEYALVKSAPPGILAEYPLASADQAVNSDYVFWQRIHGRPLLNGAPAGTLADEVRETVVDPASPGTAADLAALHVAVIVTRPTTYAYSGGSGDPRLGRGYRLIGRGSDGAQVWRVVARPAPAVAAFDSGFYPPETPPKTPTSRWLGERSGRIELVAAHPGTYVAHFSLNSYGVPRTVRLIGRNRTLTFTVAGLRTVTVPIRLPSHRSSLTITTLPGPQMIPPPDGRSVSVYLQNWTLSRLSKSSRESKPLLNATPDSNAGT
jgi:hypothetical protein